MDPLVEEEDEDCPTHPIFTNELVLEHIFSLLNLSSLKQCRLVNHFWCQQTSSAFYRKSLVNLLKTESGGSSKTGGNYFNSSTSLEVLFSYFDLCNDNNLHHPHIRFGDVSLRCAEQAGYTFIMHNILQGTTHLDFHVRIWQDEIRYVHQIISLVKKQLKNLTFTGVLEEQTELFPSTEIFPELKGIKLDVDLIPMDNVPRFLVNVFTAAPNLRELEFTGIDIADVDQVMETDFNRLYRQISELKIMGLQSQDVETVSTFLKKFVALKSLYMDGITVTDEKELETLTAAIPQSALIKLYLRFAKDAHEISNVRIPSFRNLEMLSISAWSEDKEERNDSTIRMIEYEKSFPQLKKLMLTTMRESEEVLYQTMWHDLLLPSYDNDTGAVCSSLRELVITSNVIVQDQVDRSFLQRLFSTLPNAKVFVMDKFFERDVVH